MEILLAAGANLNTADAYGVTPICIAAHKGHLQVVGMLLAAGADRNAADEYGATPILAAAENGNHQIVDMLLAAGADKNAADDGRTPIFVEAWNG